MPYVEMKQMYATSFSKEEVRRLLIVCLPCSLMLYPLSWLAVDHPHVAWAIAVLSASAGFIFGLRISAREFVESCKTDSQIMDAREAMTWRKQTRPDRIVLSSFVLHFVIMFTLMDTSNMAAFIAAIGPGAVYYSLFQIVRVPKDGSEP